MGLECVKFPRQNCNALTYCAGVFTEDQIAPKEAVLAEMGLSVGNEDHHWRQKS